MKKISTIVLFQYLSLLIIMIGGFYGILLFKNNRNLQILTIFCMSVGYLIWGIAHHIAEKTFHIKIVIEYTLLSTVVASLLIILLSMT